MSICGATSLNEIIDSLNEDELSELCSNYCNNDNATNAMNEFLTCELLNMIRCFGGQFMNLIILLIFIYWWNNQITNNYLMNSNCQLTGAISDLCQQCWCNSMNYGE